MYFVFPCEFIPKNEGPLTAHGEFIPNNEGPLTREALPFCRGQKHPVDCIRQPYRRATKRHETYLSGR